MVAQILFLFLLLSLGLQRLAEMRLSRRNEAYMLSMGGSEHSAGHFRVMQVLHLSWFLAMVLEVFVLDRPFIPLLGAAAFFLFILGQTLRYAAIQALGKRWSVRILTVPGELPVARGIYRYIRHPNYLGVVLEIAAVPLIHTAYLTAIVFSTANALLLLYRIRAEERAMVSQGSYAQVFAQTPRFLPLLRRHAPSTEDQ
jgi:methyltransferase